MTNFNEEFILSFDNSIVIYIKLEDFHIIEDFYDVKMLYKIQKRVGEYLEKKLQKALMTDQKLHHIHSGSYVLTLDKDSLDKSLNCLISTIKAFQKSVNEKILMIDDLPYQISLLISVAFDGSNRYESAKIGIKELIKNEKKFMVSNNLSKVKKLKIEHNLQILNTIKYAIKSSSVIPYFQPIIDNKTGDIIRYEALMRIIDEKSKILTPYLFLDVSKMGGYYYQLTKMMLQKSFKKAIELDIEISINLSMRDIESNLIRKIVYSLLKKYIDISHKITFELLEDEEIKDLKTILYFIKKVKEYGVKIAIDDFGKGFSNFERLLYYKPDILKIDGMLIKELDKNSYSRSIVKNIVSFAKEQDIKTVAEFVENKDIHECIKELGVDFSQGYFFDKPKEL